MTFSARQPLVRDKWDSRILFTNSCIILSDSLLLSMKSMSRGGFALHVIGVVT